MTFNEWQTLTGFPLQFITMCDYEAVGKNPIKMRAGDKFIGIKRETIGYSDFSIIDENGHPHYYDRVKIIK